MINTSDIPVMPNTCHTCPFKKDKNGEWQDEQLAEKVIGRCLFRSRQICHHNSPEQTHQCRGYYDYSTTIYKKMNLL